MNSIKRVLGLLQHQFVKDWKFLAILLGILSGIRFLDLVPFIDFDFYGPIYLLITFLVYMSGSFQELIPGDAGTASYLILPAANWEKLLAKYLFSGPILLGIAYLVYLLTSLVLAGVSLPLGAVIPPFQWDMGDPLLFLREYWFFHSLFFAGAVTFKKSSSMKTLGIFVAAAIGVVLTTLLILMALFDLSGIEDFFHKIPEDFFSMDLGMFLFKGLGAWRGFWGDQLRILGNLLHVLYYYVLPIYLLVYSYFRFCEKEVR